METTARTLGSGSEGSGDGSGERMDEDAEKLDIVEDPVLPKLLPPPQGGGKGANPDDRPDERSAVVVDSGGAGDSKRHPYIGREQKAFEQRHIRWRNAPSNLQLPERVEWWTTSQVAAWVQEIGWGRSAPRFLSNNINGEVLLMADNDMLKDIGISAAGDRHLMLRARDDLLVQQDLESISYQDGDKSVGTLTYNYGDPPLFYPLQFSRGSYPRQQRHQNQLLRDRVEQSQPGRQKY